ncbi:RE2 [Symbiodinium sp. CCMP2592]|nr:RE2 [Symbiodinium sp. CCMP2592]
MDPVMRRSRSAGPAPALLDGREVARSHEMQSSVTARSQEMQSSAVARSHEMQSVSTPHAFWSERARTESQLRQMRPATLPPLEDSSVAGHAGVTVPVGNPVSYGPVRRPTVPQPLPSSALDRGSREVQPVDGLPAATPSSSTTIKPDKTEEELIPDQPELGRLSRLETLLQTMMESQAQFQAQLSERMQRVEERSFGSIHSGKSVETVSLGKFVPQHPPGLQAPTTSIPSDVDVQRPLESSAVILEGKEYYRDALGTIWNFTAAGEWEWVDENRIPVGAVIFNMAELEEGSFARDRALAAHEVVGASTPGLMVPPKISSSVEGQGILSGAIPSAARVDVPHRNASSSIGPEVFEGPGSQSLGQVVGSLSGSANQKHPVQPFFPFQDSRGSGGSGARGSVADNAPTFGQSPGRPAPATSVSRDHTSSEAAAGVTMISGIPYKWRVINGTLDISPVALTPAASPHPGPSSSIPQVASGMGHTVERPEVLGKHVMSLPTLSEYSASNPTALGDWLAIVKPTLSSLTDSGHVWWDYTFDRASRAYTKWLSVSPLERLGIQAELEMYGTHMPQHILLEQRASILLLQAIPEVVKTDIVATRRMSPSQILFKLLTVYQPGGAHERGTMLHYLVSPTSATSVQEAIKGVRQWVQWRSRLKELHAAEPDATLLVKGLDTMVSAALDILKSLKLSQGSGANSGGVSAKKLVVDEAIVGQNVGLLDTCASHAIRTLRAGEPVPTDSVEVALATGCAHMLINSVGTLVTRETVCPVVPFHLAHSHLHVDFDVIDGRCTVVHPQKGDLKAQVLDGRIVIDRQVALDMIADLETALGDAAARGGSGSSIDDLLQGTAASKAIAGSEEDVVSGFLNVARVDGVHDRTQGVGLLDSGASHPLRSLRPGEPLPTKRVTVALALGKKEMMLTDGGTLVTSERVDPLVPIGKASELVGLQVRWRKGKCTATHPILGPLEVETVNGCPCIAEAVALRIIDEMEQKGVAHMLQSVRALQGCPSADTEHSVRECLHGAMRSGNQDDFIQACWRWLRWYYPDVPESMLVDLLPASGVGELLYNRHKRRRLKKTRRVIVHLHSGGPRLHLPSSCGEVLEVDFRTDLHSSSVWTYILSLAIEGKVVAVVGGPPCETVAQFRGVEDGGPPVLRGRCGEGRFWKDGLSYSSEELAKKDGLLFLKVLFLFETAVQARKALSLEQSSSVHAGVFFALESPQDPEFVGQKFSQIGCSVMCREDVAEDGQPSLASPTFFAWPEVRSFRTRYNLLAAHCDQGALGHYMVLQEDLEVEIPSGDSPRACIAKPCYTDDIAKSEELAREWLEQKKFSPQECLELLESVGLDFRANRRGDIHCNEDRIQAVTLGQYVRGHMCGVTNAAKHRPMFVKYLVSFVREHNPDVVFSSVYLSCNTAVGVHRDRHNDYSCNNVICALGEFTGGELWVQDDGISREDQSAVELEDWREALSDEVNNLITELQVVERTTEQQLAEMACQVRQAAEEEWFLAGLDISKAFLTAPMSQVQRQGRLIIVQPPKAAVKLGLASPSERWVVRKALYGLAESPAAWVEWRDTRLLQMRWQTDGLDMRFKKSEVDPSLYLLIATDSDGKESVKGTLGLYVDDFLLAGSMSIITDAIQQIRAEWKTSEPEFCGRGHDDKPLKFLGIQIFWNDGGIGGAGPMSKEAPPDEPEEVSVEALRKAQAAVGELLWLALKSRADLAFCTSQLSVWCTRYPRFVARKADEVFHYLSRTVTLGLKYSKVDPMSLGGDSQLRFKRSVTVLEAYTDASFAAGCEGEETARSHSGAVVVWADSPVMWMTQRQTTIALSTAEAELNAALEGTTMLQSVAPIVSMLLGINEDGLSKALYIDSVSACSIISVVAGAWRTRHLRIRAAGLRSLLNSGYLVVAHLKGEHMLADMLTKLMNGAIFVNLKQMWQMTTAPSTHLVSDAARAAAAAVAILVATMLQGYELVQATSSTSSMTTSLTTRWFDRADIGFLLVLVFVMVAVHKVVSAVFRSGMIRSWW